jgi:dTDP-glucose 4,6-dehydratase
MTIISMFGMKKIKDVIQTICEIMEVKFEDHVEYVKDRPGHDRRYAIDWSKIKRELGWQPAYDFRTALELTVVWYKKHENWWKRIKSGAYKDYYKKQYGKK